MWGIKWKKRSSKRWKKRGDEDEIDWMGRDRPMKGFLVAKDCRASVVSRQLVVLVGCRSDGWAVD